MIGFTVHAAAIIDIIGFAITVVAVGMHVGDTGLNDTDTGLTSHNICILYIIAVCIGRTAMVNRIILAKLAVWSNVHFLNTFIDSADTIVARHIQGTRDLRTVRTFKTAGGLCVSDTAGLVIRNMLSVLTLFDQTLAVDTIHSFGIRNLIAICQRITTDEGIVFDTCIFINVHSRHTGMNDALSGITIDIGNIWDLCAVGIGFTTG